MKTITIVRARRLMAATAMMMGVSGAAHASNMLPPDAANACPISKTTIAGWFASGAITANGVVSPADSTAFPTNNTNCDFYAWSAQMFLWLTSPVQLATENNTLASTFVFDGAGFYDVSPANAAGQRIFLPNTSALDNFAIRINKTDDSLPTRIGETGQAGGGGVLISQAGSLVYYGIHANNVYAEFLTGQKAGKIAQDQFPTTAADLKEIDDYATKKLADGDALTIELKTSWIDAATLTDPENYIQVQAAVPKYDRTSPSQWTLAGNELKTLALVGMHVVGSVQGHPEMIWATFEHQNNSPNGTYYYDRNGAVKVPFDPASTGYSFYNSTATAASYNQENAHVNGSGNIVSTNGLPIGPTAVVRTNPWGNAGDDAASAEENTNIISTNNNVISALAAGDIRANYVQAGAVWTKGGVIPQMSELDPNGTVTITNPKEVGSVRLSNSTMETYFQGAGNGSCFLCHDGGSKPAPDASFGEDNLSHIYFNIIPLGGAGKP